jgi:hypothetical protein
MPNDDDEPNGFRTLKGLLDGEEGDGGVFFHFRATLRVFGDAVPFDEITERLGVQPTHVHRKEERRTPRSRGYPHDMWSFQPPLPKTEPLERHIEELWNVVRPALDYLKGLKERFTVDVFCGYRSNCDHAGFEVSYKCLELFTALETTFGVSLIIA